MRRLILAISCVLAAMICSAQNGRVVIGTVFTDDGTPLSTAVLKAVGTLDTFTTNADGSFKIQVPYYVKMLEATAEGYVSAQLEIDGSYMVFKLKVDKKYHNAKAKAEEEAREAELAKAKAEAEAKAKAEEAARIAAFEKAKAEEAARIAAEKAAAEKAKAEELARKAAEEKAKADSLARAKAEEAARIAAEKAAAEKAKAEEQARIAAEKAAAEKAKAEEQARKAAEEKAKADSLAKAKAEEKARAAAEKARLAELKKAKADSLAKARAAGQQTVVMTTYQAPQNTGLVHNFELNYSYPVSGTNAVIYENLGVRSFTTLHPVEFTYSIGYRFSDMVSLSFGTGITCDLSDLRDYGDSFASYYEESAVDAISRYSRMSVPVFLNMKGYLTRGMIQPMFSVSGGLYLSLPNVSMQNMWLVDAGFGCNFKINQKSGVYVMISVATVPTLTSVAEEYMGELEISAQRSAKLAPRIKLGFTL